MRKLLLGLAILVLAAALFVACGDKKGDDNKTAAGAEKKEMVTGYNIVTGLGDVYLGTEKEDAEGNKTVTLEKTRSAGLTIGDRLRATGETEELDGKTYVAVLTDADKKIYIRDIYFIPNSIMGVVVNNDAVLYTKPSKLNPTSEKLPRQSIVAFAPAEEDADFSEIIAYPMIEGKRKYKWNVYLKKDDISSREADVQSCMLFNLAMTKDSDVVKKELLKTAISDYSTSVFITEIKQAYDLLENPDAAVAAPAVDIATESMDDPFTMVINADTSVYSAPDMTNSGIISEIVAGAEVEVNAKTVEIFTIGNMPSDVWYKISEPAGWVFGAYLDPITKNE